MADIIKKVNRGIPPVQRTQSFDFRDANPGDVLMIEESLGRPASKILIETSGTLSFRFNVYHNVFPLHDGRDIMGTNHLPNLILGGRIKDNTTAFVSLAPLETFEMDDNFPVKDIEILSAAAPGAASGVWTMTVV